MTESPLVDGTSEAPNEMAFRKTLPPSVGWRQLRWARWLPSLAALLLLLVVWGLLSEILKSLSYIFQPVFIPLLISGALAYLIKPLVDWLDSATSRWIHQPGLRHTLVVLTAMAVAVMGLIVALFVIVPSLAQQLTQAAKKLPAGYQRVTAIVQPYLESLRDRYPTQYEHAVESIRGRIDDPSALVEPLLTGLSATFSNAIGVATSVINLLLIPFFVYYMLKDAGTLQRRALVLIPGRHRATATDMLSKVGLALSSFVRGQLVVCFSMSVLYTIGFSLLGVPSALSLGFLSGFGHLIPYIGTFLAGLLTCTLALSDAPSFLHLGLVIGVYVVVQSIESFYLTPFVLGDRLDLHPFLVIIGLLIGHHLFGILGVILTVPSLAVGKVLVGIVIEYYEKSDFYRYGSGPPVTSVSPPRAPDNGSPEPSMSATPTAV
ncbi:AI-2E family transporter [Chloracidobacterium validum]|uniref:AI-2E family transporter n=1 Tax=Chloracidobacterium validum TaxID=2821543 RepID=A0ABX8B920_9BACT|nr:AI-2E family transporter [Chloracidobacterium validum]QUW02942.1 AI-2E family transporter [Chloracidobacterium validum]